MTPNKTNHIKLYGNSWCPDSYRAKLILTKNQIEFIEYDIDMDPEAEAYVIQHNQGNRSVPTIVFPDGVVLVEPSSTELRQKIAKLIPASTD